MGPSASRSDDRPSGGAGQRLGLEPVLERRTVRTGLPPCLLDSRHQSDRGVPRRVVLARQVERYRPIDAGDERRRSAMRMYVVLFLAAVFALFPLDGAAGEKQLTDVKDLAGSWRGWVTGEMGQERATMIV